MPPIKMKFLAANGILKSCAICTAAPRKIGEVSIKELSANETWRKIERA